MSAVRLIILAILIASSAAMSAASTVHHVRFSQGAVVLIWSQGTLIGQGDTVQINGFAPPSPERIIGSGQLVDFSATGPKTITLEIASNTGFAIRTRNVIDPKDLSVRLVSTGPNAQVTLDYVIDPQTIFQQSAKTARRPGTPQSQAITLEISWSGETAPNLYAQVL